MAEREVVFGPVTRGIYIAMISIAPVVPLLYPEHFKSYIILLLFLGFCLHPLLELTGLYQLWHRVVQGLQTRWDRSYLKQRRRKIDTRERDKLYRASHSRTRDSRLPRHW